MSIVSAVPSPLKYSESELLGFLLSYSALNENPVAVWRLPGTNTTHVIIANDCRKLKIEDSIETLPAGFLVAPFDKFKSRLYLSADQLFTFTNGALIQHATPVEERSFQWLQSELPKHPIRKFNPAPVDVSPAPDMEKGSFLRLVQLGLDEIERGTIQKIVPSRTRTITLPEKFDLVDAFQKLCHAHPQALVSLLNIPGEGTWLGATPELLVSVDDRKIFKTVALAGTLPYHPGTDLRTVSWTEKEIEEQALVERYVISCFKKIRLREYDEHGPRTVIAGNLLHLKSEFTVDMQATEFPQIGSVMLDLLHPTSAVCGMPLTASLEFLKEHESYDRELYAGYLGPVNVRDKIQLFVNLRCMQLCGNTAIVYAGAGVTNDSIPEKEWTETEMKLDTLLNVIF